MWLHVCACAIKRWQDKPMWGVVVDTHFTRLDYITLSYYHWKAFIGFHYSFQSRVICILPQGGSAVLWVRNSSCWLLDRNIWVPAASLSVFNVWLDFMQWHVLVQTLLGFLWSVRPEGALSWQTKTLCNWQLPFYKEYAADPEICFP